jgi:hypothetical protein
VRDRRPVARLEADVVQERVVEAADERRCRRRRASSRSSAHVIVTTPSAAMLIMNVFSVFFERTRPA